MGELGVFDNNIVYYERKLCHYNGCLLNVNLVYNQRWNCGTPIYISVVNDSFFHEQRFFFVVLCCSLRSKIIKSNRFPIFSECKISTQLFVQTTGIFPLWIPKAMCFLIHGKVYLMAKVDCSLKHHEFIVLVGRIYSTTIHGKLENVILHSLESRSIIYVKQFMSITWFI